MTVRRHPREVWIPRHIVNQIPSYELVNRPGERFCVGCKRQRPWRGKVKRAGWQCSECRA